MYFNCCIWNTTCIFDSELSKTDAQVDEYLEKMDKNVPDLKNKDTEQTDTQEVSLYFKNLDDEKEDLEVEGSKNWEKGLPFKF